MRKSLLALLAVILCSLPSCITIKMDDETKQRMDAATAEVKRLNDEILTFQKDIQALVDEIQKLRNAFAPKKPPGQ
jgi:peptidoglycan hydrolase CwlO-like protein